MTWEASTAAWWVDEVGGDGAYRRDVDPLLRSLLPEPLPAPVVDLGCGDGRLAPAAGGVVGVDTSMDLARLASARMPVCVADAARLPFGDGALRGAYAVLVLEHVAEAGPLLLEAARVIAAGGFLVVVLNHPVYTAPGSGPFIDPDDGEVLWRWGAYLERGWSDEPAGDGTVRFHHRPLGALLSDAASAGWALEVLDERPMNPAGDPLLEAQRQVPRLAGLRWRRSVSGREVGLAG